MGVKIQQSESRIETYICDECKVGEMKTTGRTLLSSPPFYGHQCGHCNAQAQLRTIYPRVVNEVVEQRVQINEDDGELEGYVGRN